MRMSRWELAARRLFYAANVASFLVRRGGRQAFALASECFVVFSCADVPLSLRLTTILCLMGGRILPKNAENQDPSARRAAWQAKRDAKLDAITEARLRNQPWRRRTPRLSIPEEHVGRCFSNAQERRPGVIYRPHGTIQPVPTPQSNGKTG